MPALIADSSNAVASGAIGGIDISDFPGFTNSAINRRILARRFSLKLNNRSKTSAWVRILRARGLFRAHSSAREAALSGLGNNMLPNFFS
jgi:hypothetical protein